MKQMFDITEKLIVGQSDEIYGVTPISGYAYPRCGKYSTKKWLEEPTSFLDHVYLWCTQRQCEISKDIVDKYRIMFESRISAGATEKSRRSENLRVSLWSYGMEGHAKKYVERFCESANKTTQQLHKVTTPCIDDHHFKKKEVKSVGELSKVCSQIVLKFWNLARVGKHDIQLSVNKHARSITKWTKACDKRPSRLISYIHHTSEYKQYYHVRNTAKQCRLGLFQDSDFARDLKDSKSTSDETLCISRVTRSFQSAGCTWNRSQFHTVRLDRIPALDLWDMIVTLFHGNTNQIKPEKRNLSTSLTRKSISGKIDDLDNVDFISSNVLFEDNEVVIKLITKGYEVLQWDMFPEPTELFLIDCLRESNWTPRFKSNTGWSSLICVSSSKCVYMCVAPCPFWVHFGSILGPFWVHFGSILGPFWVHFGSILGSILGPFWVHFGSIVGPLWVHCGSIWVDFGSIFGSILLVVWVVMHLLIGI